MCWPSLAFRWRSLVQSFWALLPLGWDEGTVFLVENGTMSVSSRKYTDPFFIEGVYSISKLLYTVIKHRKKPYTALFIVIGYTVSISLDAVSVLR